MAFQKSITLDGELFCGRGLFNQTVSIVKTSGSSRWGEVKYQVCRLHGLSSLGQGIMAGV